MKNPDPLTLRSPSGPEHFAAVVRRALPQLEEKTVSHYATGTRFEHKTRDDLQLAGYDVIRAAGSKGSTKVDLAAFKPGQLLLIQCKSNGVLAPGEWDRIVEVARWVDAIALLAANGPRGRGVTYIRLLAPKLRGLAMARQPCEVFHLDQIAAANPPNAPQEPSTALGEGSGHARHAEALSGRFPHADAWPTVGQV